LRAVAQRIVHDVSRARMSSTMHLRRFSGCQNFDPARGCARGWIYAIVRNTALKMQENAARELVLDDDTLNAICERTQTIPNPASCIPDSMVLRTMLDHPSQSAARACCCDHRRAHSRGDRRIPPVPVGTVKAWIRRELVAMRRQLDEA